METKKVLGVIFSLIFVGLFIFVLTWGVINFNKVKDGMSGTGIYTEQDINSAYEDGYNTALKDKDEYNELINSYRDTITTQTDQISQLKNEVNTLTNKNKDYTTQIDGLNQNKENNEQTILALELEIEDNELEISMLENNILELDKTIEALNKELENDDVEIQILEDNIASLNRQIDSLNDTIDSLETANSNYAEQILSLSNQNTLLSNQIITLQNELTNNDSQIIELTSRIADLEKSISYYEDYIFELENDNHFVGIFEFDGSVYDICEADDNNKVSITNPESTEFVIFNYWMVNNEQVDLNTYVLTENTKFVANVTYRHTVKFLVDDTEYNKQVVENGSKILVPENPTKDKFDFLGWSVNGTDVINIEEYIIDSDTTFIAIFRNKYGLFNADNGVLIYSWDELIDYDYLIVENGVLSDGSNIKRLSGNLYIDDEIEEISVSTFFGCSALVGVEMSNVKVIENSAFFGCSSLTNVVLSDDLLSIGNSVFKNCNLLNYYIEDNCKYLSSRNNSQLVLMGTTTRLSTYKIPSTCKFIYDNAFDSHGSLTSIEIPNNVKYIGASVFSGCSNLVNVTLNEGLESIDYSAFYECSSLTSIVIPNSVIDLGSSLFAYCSSLAEVILPYTLTKIAYGTFIDCSNLYSIEIPSTVTEIGEAAFRDCENLQNIVIPNSVEIIGNSAFSRCYSLTNIYIPASVIYLAEDVSSSAMWIYGPFYACSDLNIYCGASGPLATWGNCYNLYRNSVTDYKEFKYGYTYEQYLAEIAGQV